MSGGVPPGPCAHYLELHFKSNGEKIQNGAKYFYVPILGVKSIVLSLMGQALSS